MGSTGASRGTTVRTRRTTKEGPRVTFKNGQNPNNVVFSASESRKRK